jgi:signal transduction histidine kinase
LISEECRTTKPTLTPLFRPIKTNTFVRLFRKEIPLAEIWELCNSDNFRELTWRTALSLSPFGRPAQKLFSDVLDQVGQITQANQAIILTHELSSRRWHRIAEYKKGVFEVDNSTLNKLANDFTKSEANLSEPEAWIEQVVINSHPHGFLIVPIIIEKSLVGMFVLVRDESGTDFTETDFVMAAFTERICGSHLANRVFAKDLVRHKSREDELFNEICRCQASERQRIGQELHDGIAQWIVGAAMEIDSCQIRIMNGQLKNLQYSLNSAKDTLQTCIIELRRAIANLRPFLITELGLVGAVNQLAQSFNSGGLVCTLQIKDPLPDFSLAEENTIFWIVQEALNNIRKHASASQAVIEFIQHRNSFDISIRDNGKGYDQGNIGESVFLQNKFGLTGMRERANLIGGELMVIGTPGEGTRVIFRINKHIDALTYERGEI